jgi:putative hydrolase of the HAD superfamily
VREWSASCGSVNPAVLQLVKEQRPLRRVALFSNATSRLPSDLERLGLDEWFDHVLNSSELGVAKLTSRPFGPFSLRSGPSPKRAYFSTTR